MNKQVGHKRLLGKTVDNLTNFITIVERVDQFIDYSEYFSMTSNEITVYGTLEVLFVGREVNGHDPYINDHEEWSIRDIMPAELIEEQAQAQEYEALIHYCRERLLVLKKSEFRVLINRNGAIHLSFF